MVLVDSSHPDQHEPAFLLGPANRMSPRVRRFLCAASPWMVNLGIVRLFSPQPRAIASSGFTAEQAMVLAMLESQPTAFRAQADQTCAATNQGAILPDGGTGNPEVDNATRRAGSLGARPLVVLTAGRYWKPDDPVLAKQADEFHDVWVHQLQCRALGRGPDQNRRQTVSVLFTPITFRRVPSMEGRVACASAAPSSARNA